MTPRLSICIATYGRAMFIDETLRSIVGQGLESLEIVIVDGASPDNTAEVVAPYVEQFPSQVHYHREPVKGGVDQDYAKAVSYARGDYCWLLSDDDPLKPGAISAVIDAIAGNFSVVVVNAEVRNIDLSRTLEARRLRIERNRDIVDLTELSSTALYYLTFIGCIVISRKLWNERPHEIYFGSEFIHLGVIFQAPLPNPVRIISEPLIILRYGNSQWSARSFEIWMCKFPRLIWSFSTLPEAERLRVTSREPWRNLLTVCSFRAKGSYDKSVYTRLLRPLAMSWSMRFALIAIAWFPGVLANSIACVIFAVGPRRSPLSWVGLRNSRFNLASRIEMLWARRAR